MRNEHLSGKLERLLEELRVHGGNGRSVYAARLRSDIAMVQAELVAGNSVHQKSREDSQGARTQGDTTPY